MILVSDTKKVVVLEVKFRKAGSFVADDGRHIEYAGGLFMYYVPVGVIKGEILKMKVKPEVEEKIGKMFDAVYPGALAEIITDSDNMIIDAKIVQK